MPENTPQKNAPAKNNPLRLIAGCAIAMLLAIVLFVGSLLAFIFINPSGLATPWRNALGL